MCNVRGYVFVVGAYISAYMCACVCISHTYVRIHTQREAGFSTRTQIYAKSRVYAYVCAHAYICAHVHTLGRTHAHTHTHARRRPFQSER